jgi:hypothetical protein
MISFQDMPSVGASTERLADWVEVKALTSANGLLSRPELIGALRISGSADCQDDSDDEGDQTSPDEIVEGVADSVFAELDDRQKATGGEAGCYPFELSENLLETRDASDKSVYAFLVLLAHWSKEDSAQFKQGVKVFEQLSAEAARNYLGGPFALESRALVFGFPRTDMAKGFANALRQLCREVGEGHGPHRTRPRLTDQNDAKLDVVAWTSFLDDRSGKLIAFGQCAAGIHWREKRAELPDPADWWKIWIQGGPAVKPIKMFFVPHRVSRDEWFMMSAIAGILFDRCRIAHLASAVPEGLKTAHSGWTLAALRQLRTQ